MGGGEDTGCAGMQLMTAQLEGRPEDLTEGGCCMKMWGLQVRKGIVTHRCGQLLQVMMP